MSFFHLFTVLTWQSTACRERLVDSVTCLLLVVCRKKRLYRAGVLLLKIQFVMITPNAGYAQLF
jgi:hypothetical protein